MTLAVWLLVTMTVGCVCFVVGHVHAAVIHRVGPWSDDRPADRGPGSCP